MDVGLELRAARLRSGLSQRALAEAVSTSQAAVSAYEAGRKQPSVSTYARLLAACGARLAVQTVPSGGADALRRRAADWAAGAREGRELDRRIAREQTPQERLDSGLGLARLTGEFQRSG